MNRITIRKQSQIEALVAPPSGEYSLRDSDVPGLSLRVRSSGQKTWVVRYRMGGRGSQARRLTLGDARNVTLNDARDAARKALGMKAKNLDPQVNRRETSRHVLAEIWAAIHQLENRVDKLERRQR